MLIDLHCHTTRSIDSRLSPEAAIGAAKGEGLDAICFTEHDHLWPRGELRELSAEYDFPLFRGVEVSTEIGHVLAFGLTEFDLALRRFDALVEAARRDDAVLVLAHPYRRFFRFELPTQIDGDDLAEALKRRGLANVHAVEAGNGATRELENRLAEMVADRLSLPTTAGSDAHSVETLGRFFTMFDDDIRSERDLVTAIVDHRVSAAQRVEAPRGSTRRAPH